ncbi:hypothetical protein NDU88_002117 [Pleurodeles waltl]|uniref:Uncharacterized protein n=1 Tax=Pleurodeles waltl TaxID=8319 RepID=A0AAV7LJD8_PLEWA|nr:hypothetical protein NDU88_002117 [Pleurodeles waltl]
MVTEGIVQRVEARVVGHLSFALPSFWFLIPGEWQCRETVVESGRRFGVSGAVDGSRTQCVLRETLPVFLQPLRAVYWKPSWRLEGEGEGIPRLQ